MNNPGAICFLLPPLQAALCSSSPQCSGAMLRNGQSFDWALAHPLDASAGPQHLQVLAVDQVMKSTSHEEAEEAGEEADDEEEVS